MKFRIFIQCMAVGFCGISFLITQANAGGRAPRSLRDAIPVADEMERSQEGAQKLAQILRVTSDAQSGILDIQLNLDNDGNIRALTTLADTGVREEFSPEQFFNGGIVFLRKEGRDVVKLSSEKFDVKAGGVIDLIYLSNGIFNTYGKFSMELTRMGDQWDLYLNDQTGRKKFSEMFLRGKKFFGKIIGIDKVEVH
mgnify:CR=1 FL=1